MSLRPEHVADLLARPLELSRIDGRLLQVPRNIDVRLLHYRQDLLDRRVPATWSELAERATELTTASTSGFLFPGRDSGLFGTFYELLVGAGGELFDGALRPAFNSTAGVWAAAFIADLHHVRRVTPRALPDWHYDEISAAFREGHAAMVCDWPGSYHLYRDPGDVPRRRSGRPGVAAGRSIRRQRRLRRLSFVRDSADVAQSSRGERRCCGCLTSFDAQLGEARRGAIPCRSSALARVREEAEGNPLDAARWQLLAETEATMIVPPRFAAYPRVRRCHLARRPAGDDWRVVARGGRCASGR